MLTRGRQSPRTTAAAVIRAIGPPWHQADILFTGCCPCASAWPVPAGGLGEMGCLCAPPLAPPLPGDRVPPAVPPSRRQEGGDVPHAHAKGHRSRSGTQPVPVPTKTTHKNSP